MSFSYCRLPLSYCMLTGPLLCRKRDRRFLMPLLIKAAMQSGWGSPTLTTSSEPGHLPKAPPPNTITLRSDVSTRVLREQGHSVHGEVTAAELCSHTALVRTLTWRLITSVTLNKLLCDCLCFCLLICKMGDTASPQIQHLRGIGSRVAHRYKNPGLLNSVIYKTVWYLHIIHTSSHIL